MRSLLLRPDRFSPLSLSVLCLCILSVAYGARWRPHALLSCLPAPRLFRLLFVLFAAQSSFRPEDSRDLPKSRQYARATSPCIPPQAKQTHAHLPSASSPVRDFGDRPSALWPLIFGDRPSVYHMGRLFHRVLHVPVLLPSLPPFHPRCPIQTTHPSCRKQSCTYHPLLWVSHKYSWPHPSLALPVSHMSQAPPKKAVTWDVRRHVAAPRATQCSPAPP